MTASSAPRHTAALTIMAARQSLRQRKNRAWHRRNRFAILLEAELMLAGQEPDAFALSNEEGLMIRAARHEVERISAR